MEQSIVTLRDVARAADVHPGTASRALNPETRSQVKVETAERVMAAAAELGYRVNPIARSLRTSRSLTVGVLIPDLTNPFYPPIVRGVEDELSAGSYVALVANTDGDFVKERRVLETLRERQVDGLIVMTAKRKHPLIVEVAETGLPMVLVSRDVDGLSVSGVMLDDEEAMSLAVGALTDLGHSRLAHLSGPRTVSTALRRRQGFVKATKRLPTVTTTIVESAQFSIEAGRAAGEQLLAAHPEVTGIVAANDMIALGCLSAYQAASRSCPRDFSVIGVNDSQFLDHTSPPLSTVSVPKYEMGRSAAQLLLSQLQANGGRPAAEVRHMRPEIKMRGSTGPAPH
ncbi:MAG: LacI family DNA-binding transcriptional regulator [Nocardioides sp.]